jgi:hypothetical protein
MALTAVLNASDLSLAGKANTKAEIAAIVGETPDNFVLVTRKEFEPSEQYATFDAMIGKVKAEKPAKEPKPATARAGAPALEGEYHLLKPLPACADDHPKKPIWVAIESNTTVEAAKAACPEVNPPRKTNGVYTFASEFRYFLKAEYVAMGAAPEATEPAQAEEATA